MADTLVYEPYNHKSLVIRGDRSKYGTMIKNLGGRWNPKLLKGGVGWTFPKSREGELKKMIESIKQDKQLSEMKNHAKSRKGQLKYHRAISEEESESEEDENDEESENDDKEEEESEESEEGEESEESDTDQRFEKLKKKKQKKPEKLKIPETKNKKQVLREVKKKPKQKAKNPNKKHKRSPHRHDRLNGFDKQLDYYRHFSKKSKKTRSDSESESDSDYSESESSLESSSDSSGFPSYENSPRIQRQKKKSHDPSIEDRLNVLQRRVWELEMERKRR